MDSNFKTAPLGKRASALCIDLFCITGLQMVLGGMTIFSYDLLCQYNGMETSGQIALMISQFTGMFLFLWYFTFVPVLVGNTVGKRATGIKVLCIHSRGQLTVKQNFLRGLGYLLSSSIYLLGFAVAWLRKDKKTLHDLLLDTVVVLDPSSSAVETKPEPITTAPYSDAA